ncbi:sensor histidine kinase [Ureibacillus terrenus]|nr:sensor histidine kinase [Ureibacillus terrenus]MED3762833.1 sensor histidine kinase [Ureibacillus terrenus]
MKHWYMIFPRSKWISIYIWIIFCILPFYFLVRTLSPLQIFFGVVLILLYFLSYYFSFLSNNGLVYMWVSFGMALNILMTLFYGYVYLSIFTSFFIGNIKSTVGFYIMYGLHIGFTILSIAAGYFIELESFLSQTPFIIITVVGVVMLPIAIYSRNKQENLAGELESAKERIAELIIHEERQRIARDLHDTLGQKLSMIGLKSDLASRLVEKNPKAAIQEIKEIRHTARIALKEVRELVSHMKAVKLSDELGRVEEMLEAAGIRYELIGDLQKLNIPVLVENVLSMCLKEAVTNIVKHSGAKNCRIEIRQNQNEMSMIIEDDGEGITERTRFEGNGLKGMRERLEFINGSLMIESNPGAKLTITVPLTITHQEGSAK